MSGMRKICYPWSESHLLHIAKPKESSFPVSQASSWSWAFGNKLHNEMKTGIVIKLMSLHNWSFTQWLPTQISVQTTFLRGGQRELKSSKNQFFISEERRCNLQWINFFSKLVSPRVLAKQGLGHDFSREQQKAPCKHCTENAVTCWLLVQKHEWEGRPHQRQQG